MARNMLHIARDMRTVTPPADLAHLRLLGPAIPEAGGGWVFAHGLLDKRLAGLEVRYRVIAVGRHHVQIIPRKEPDVRDKQ